MPSTKSSISQSKEYLSFRTAVARKTVVVDSSDGTEEKKWKIYDHGPREVRCPLILLPPASGTADVFYKQQLSLGTSGYRVIAVDYPPFWTHEEWCEGFLKLLDQLRLDQVHLFGASLGGFLAQKFAVYTATSQRVQSIILCNAFTDTGVFKSMPPSNSFKYLPVFVMRRLILNNYPSHKVESEVADSIDFMIERLDLLTQKELASRLTLNMATGYVEPQHIASQDIKVMIMSVMDQTAITNSVMDEMQKCYPEAKEAHVKDGGNFPYLSRDQEVNMYLKVHLRQFEKSRYSAGDDFDWGQSTAGVGGSGDDDGGGDDGSGEGGGGGAAATKD